MTGIFPQFSHNNSYYSATYVKKRLYGYKINPDMSGKKQNTK